MGQEGEGVFEGVGQGTVSTLSVAGAQQLWSHQTPTDHGASERCPGSPSCLKAVELHE